MNADLVIAHIAIRNLRAEIDELHATNTALRLNTQNPARYKFGQAMLDLEHDVREYARHEDGFDWIADRITDAYENASR